LQVESLQKRNTLLYQLMPETSNLHPYIPYEKLILTDYYATVVSKSYDDEDVKTLCTIPDWKDT